MIRRARSLSNCTTSHWLAPLIGFAVLARVAGVALQAAAADDQSARPSFVYSHSAGIVPGAIVCPDLPTTQAMYQQYVAAAEGQAGYAIMQRHTGHARELYGAPPGDVDLAAYGCVLIPGGQKMEFRGAPFGVPLVTVRLKGGKRLQGVTLPSMVAAQAPQ